LGQFKHVLANFYEKHQHFTNISLLVLLTLVVFYNSLGSYLFEVDDFNSLLHTHKDLSKVLITNTYGNNLGGNYRPIEVLAHQFDLLLYGENDTYGRNLSNLIMHILNIILVYILSTILTKKKFLGLLAGSIFAVFIIHSYSLSPVTWISARVDLTVSFFYLLTIILFIRFLTTGSVLIYIITFLTFILALWSKEMAVTLPLIIFLFIVFFSNNENYQLPFKLPMLIPFLRTILIIGVLALIMGFIFNPNFIRYYLTSDNMIERETIQRINFLQRVTFIMGGTSIIISSFFLLLINYSKKSIILIKPISYSLPYFIILYFYISVRYLVLGSIGGLYKSPEGKAVSFNLGFDSLMRDIYGLAGFVWPVGIDYNISVFSLQINYTFIFYAVSVATIITLAFIFFKLIISHQRELSFSYLWIFITLLPVHNILVAPWYFNQRYLYLPSIGFCIFISIIMYKLTKIKKIPSRLINASIILITLLVLTVSSILIVRHNAVLVGGSKLTENIVLDLKKYQSKITDKTKLVFINYPLSSFSSNSTIFIESYIRDILGFISGYGPVYEADFILLCRSKVEDELVIKWLDDKVFIVDGIVLTNYFFIPSELSPIGKQIETIYKKPLVNPLLRSLSLENKQVETINAFITVLEFDKKLNSAKLKIELKDKVNKSTRDNLFYLYYKSHLNLVKVISVPEES